MAPRPRCNAPVDAIATIIEPAFEDGPNGFQYADSRKEMNIDHGKLIVHADLIKKTVAVAAKPQFFAEAHGASNERRSRKAQQLDAFRRWLQGFRRDHVHSHASNDAPRHAGSVTKNTATVGANPLPIFVAWS